MLLGCLLNHYHSNVCPCALVCRVASFYKRCQPCASKRMMKGAGTLDSHFNTRKRTSQPAAPAKATRSASAVAKREQATSAAATGPHTDGEPTPELSRSSAAGSQHAQHAQCSLCCVCMPCSQGPLHAHRSPPAFPIVASLERQHATVRVAGVAECMHACACSYRLFERGREGVARLRPEQQVWAVHRHDTPTAVSLHVAWC